MLTISYEYSSSCLALIRVDLRYQHTLNRTCVQRIDKCARNANSQYKYAGVSVLDGLIFVEKGLGVYVQRMLKIGRIYTLVEILSKIFVKETKEYWGPYLRSWFDKTIWCQLIFIKIYYLITACTTYTFTFGKC